MNLDEIPSPSRGRISLLFEMVLGAAGHFPRRMAAIALPITAFWMMLWLSYELRKFHTGDKISKEVAMDFTNAGNMYPDATKSVDPLNSTPFHNSTLSNDQVDLRPTKTTTPSESSSSPNVSNLTALNQSSGVQTRHTNSNITASLDQRNIVSPRFPSSNMTVPLNQSSVATPRGGDVKDTTLILNQSISVIDGSKTTTSDQNMTTLISNRTEAPPASSGFVVLGMHRSGTSLLTGLLVKGCAYNVGDGLLLPAKDNKRGFFERADVMNQNNAFMSAQQISWSSGVLRYNSTLARHQKESGIVKFDRGEKALEFLCNPSSFPWVMKDPRVCITLPSWLELLRTCTAVPAILFTYRHPLQVAMSLRKRNKIPIQQGLFLWVAYNLRAIENSQGFCRITTSVSKVLADPLGEVQRISDALTSKCRVLEPSRRLSMDVVNEFVDPNLQHNVLDVNRTVIAEYDGGCKAYEYDSQNEIGSREYDQEMRIYTLAMKVYCDLESGKAYESNYSWAEVESGISLNDALDGNR